MVSLRPFQYVLLVSSPHGSPLALLGACQAAAGCGGLAFPSWHFSRPADAGLILSGPALLGEA